MFRRHLITVAFILVFSAPSLASAVGFVSIVPQDSQYNCNGSGGCNSVCAIAQLAQNALNDAIYLAVVLSAVLFAWAGFKYLTAVAGSDISSAKAIFFNVAIGLLIIVGGWLVIDTLMKTLVGTGGSFGPWNKIC